MVDFARGLFDFAKKKIDRNIYFCARWLSRVSNFTGECQVHFLDNVNQIMSLIISLHIDILIFWWLHKSRFHCFRYWIGSLLNKMRLQINKPFLKCGLARVFLLLPSGIDIIWFCINILIGANYSEKSCKSRWSQLRSHRSEGRDLGLGWLSP